MVAKATKKNEKYIYKLTKCWETYEVLLNIREEELYSGYQQRNWGLLYIPTGTIVYASYSKTYITAFYNQIKDPYANYQHKFDNDYKVLAQTIDEVPDASYFEIVHIPTRKE